MDRLFAALPDVEPYPPGVVPLRARIAGTAFFPGGAGLWGARAGQLLPSMPVGEVMILGHDFHSETAFERSYAEGTEVPAFPSGSQYRMSPTWHALLALFRVVGMAPERCFYTNAYMGLRKGSGTTGRFPGARDAGFVERCRSFFLRQYAEQQPRVILTLGVWVPAFLAPLAPALTEWQSARSMGALDAVGPLRSDVRFRADLPLCSVAVLTHPSLRGSNVGRRRYGGLTGHDAEVALLNAALRS